MVLLQFECEWRNSKLETPNPKPETYSSLKVCVEP